MPTRAHCGLWSTTRPPTLTPSTTSPTPPPMGRSSSSRCHRGRWHAAGILRQPGGPSGGHVGARREKLMVMCSVTFTSVALYDTMASAGISLSLLRTPPSESGGAPMRLNRCSSTSRIRKKIAWLWLLSSSLRWLTLTELYIGRGGHGDTRAAMRTCATQPILCGSQTRAQVFVCTDPPISC
jgi:hypothetical protein